MEYHTVVKTFNVNQCNHVFKILRNFYDMICFQLNFSEDILLVGTKEGHLLQYRIKKGTGKTL